MNDDKSEPDREDNRQAELLRGLAAHPNAPDEAFLASLGERSRRAFEQATAADGRGMRRTEGQRTEGQRADLGNRGKNESRFPPKNERQAKSTVMVRSWALMVATAAAVLFWFQVDTPPAVSGAPFSTVLAELKKARTLEFRVTRDGQTSEVWVRSPGLVRWDEGPGRYRIAAGNRLWRIDEQSKTTTASNSPWFSSAGEPVDLVRLLADGIVDTSPLAAAMPAGRATFDGHECLVYRATVQIPRMHLSLEAFVDAAHPKQLRGIVARRPNSRGTEVPSTEVHGLEVPVAELHLVAVNPPVDEAKFAMAKSLVASDRIGKISDVQGVVGLRPVMARRWTPVYREIALRPGDWIRTDIRGANAGRVRLASETELTLGPGSLLECISPTQARLHAGEVQVNLPRREEKKGGGAEGRRVGGKGGEREEVTTRSVETPFELVGPQAGGETFAAPGKTFLRVDRTGKLAKLDDVKAWPKWLAGFEGTATQESLGSLIVNLPDGRNEPLTVGYHKVSVEIRDQIARTTIEESFVNHTAARLEGVFHFPLPSDASISGFGMWIGDELVEADVVEKQRAREIYETILRERRDPGLLEWTSGNLFKARVFPIEAHSEKRVKIVYTQVLPLRGDEYRYTYGLRSDLLRTKPVRELSLSVTIDSALPLARVACSTHPVRTQLAEHSAKVEFAAQDYTPDRDFEVVCELGARQSDVVVIPHRRGDDGYLLVQLMPPGVEGNFRREVLPDGEPLSLVLLCDTSGSMDSEKRRQQAEFVASLLSSLGDQDRFLLAATDTSTAWFDAEPQPATNQRIDQVGKFLDGRISLGWTDLDQAVQAVLAKTPAGAQVIYIGDGMVTAGDRKPASYVNRFHGLLAAHRAAKLAAAKPDAVKPETAKLETAKLETAKPETAKPETAIFDTVTPAFHTVSVGNTYEAVVLKGMAAAGGSTRAISGERSPQLVANELLGELASPGWRDLAVEFRGVQTAAVYPDKLPNVAAGTQQLLVARYLPEGNEQTGEIVVTGKRGNEAVRYAAKIRFAGSDDGNSFIPRLWARSHLDHLLAQGAGQEIRDDILRLSEEFHIITPHTSLLVLETDADRERFGVKRRFEMRDGERFFQKGTDSATFELARQQMLRAGDWRIGLRRDVIRRLALLGRNPQLFARDGRYVKPLFAIANLRESAAIGGNSHWAEGYFDANSRGFNVNGGSFSPGRYGEALLGTLGGSFDAINGPWDADEDTVWVDLPTFRFVGDGFDEDSSQRGRFMLGVGINSNAGLLGSIVLSEQGDRDDFLVFPPASLNVHGQTLPNPIWYFDDVEYFPPGPEFKLARDGADLRRKKLDALDFDWQGEPYGVWRNPLDGIPDRATYDTYSSVYEYDGVIGPHSLLEGVGGYFDLGGIQDSTRRLTADSLFDREYTHGYSVVDLYDTQSAARQAGMSDISPWLNRLFPHLPPPPAAQAQLPDPKGWSPEALGVARNLLRNESLRQMKGGVVLERSTESFDPTWDRSTGRSADLVCYSPTAWFTRPHDAAGNRVANYCNDKERGVFSISFGLGQTRSAVERDRTTFAPTAETWMYTPLFESYAGYTGRVEPAGENRMRLVVAYNNTQYVRRFLIDTTRNVVLEVRDESQGKVTSTVRYSDFTEAGGVLWVGKIEGLDDRDRTTSRTTYRVRGLPRDDFEVGFAGELSLAANVQFLRQPAPRLADARRRVNEGSATFDDRILLALVAGNRQLGDDLLEHLAAAEKIAAEKIAADNIVRKPGVRWLRTVVLGMIRRNNEARLRHLDEARMLIPVGNQSATPHPDDLFLAGFLLSCDQATSSPAEQLELLEVLRPIFERKPVDPYAMTQLRDNLIRIYQQLSRSELALAELKAQAESLPWETHRQTNYAQALVSAGRLDEAKAWLERQLARPIERSDSDDDTLRASWFQMVKARGQWESLIDFTTKWIQRKPATQTGYEHHLDALLSANRLDEAFAFAERWLKEACIDGPRAGDVQARLQAALRLAEGYLPGLTFQHAPVRLRAPLAAAVRYFLGRDDDVQLVRQMLGGRFCDTEEADRIRGEMLRLLMSEKWTVDLGGEGKDAKTDAQAVPAGDITRSVMTTLSVERLRLYVEMTFSGRMELAEPLAVPGGTRRQLNPAEVPDAVWKAIAEKLRTRWEAAVKAPGAKVVEPSVGDPRAADPQSAETQRQLGEVLTQIYRSRFTETELLPFLRRRLETADDATRPDHRAVLVNALLTHSWTEEIEREAFALLEQLPDKTEPGMRLAVQVPALHQLVDTMLAARQTAATKQLTDGGESHKLTRTERAAKVAEFAKAAQTGLADRLAAAASAAAERKDLLADWYEVEAARFRIHLQRDLDKLAAFAKRKIGDAPPNVAPPAELQQPADPAQIAERLFANLLYGRALAIETYLAVRPGTNAKAAEATAAELLTYIDKGIAAGTEKKNDRAATAWRRAKFDLLVALDRPDELDRALREWVRTEPPTAPWRRSLALLTAERGNLDEAITLFEAIEKLKMLDASDYQRLADWYLARNRRADNERAVAASYRQMPEQALSQFVQSAINARQRVAGGTPSDPDPRVIPYLRVLFEKAAAPEQYVHLVRQWYQADRDFRALEMLPDVVLGRSPQQIYRLLVEIKNGVLVDLRNEAAADPIMARIATLRAGERTETDLRALDLLEALIERQSAEVQNEKGPHVAACLAALKRAFARRRADGEPREMALFLTALGKLPDPSLEAEQLHELHALGDAGRADESKPGESAAARRDRLVITAELAKLLFYSYGRQDEALQLFEAELTTYEQAHDGRLPIQDDDTFDQYLSLLSNAGRHAAVEAALLAHLKNTEHGNSDNAGQRAWFNDRLWDCYNVALERRGEVSLGSGEKLFLALLDFGYRRIDGAASDYERAEGVRRIVYTFSHAHRLNLAGIRKPLEEFAFERMPPILRQLTTYYLQAAGQAMTVIEQVLGPKAGTRYLLEAFELRTPIADFTANYTWTALGSNLATSRAKAAEQKVDISDLEPRIWAILSAELKRDLREGTNRNGQMYDRRHSYFWNEKAAAFATIAEEVYRERKSSGRGVLYIADYVRHGLGLQPRSIEMLLIAHADGLLDLPGRDQLIAWLQEDGRWAESITLLEPMIELEPDAMRHRTRLLRAYFHAQRPQQLAEFLRETDEHFGAGGRRTAGSMAELAQAAGDCGLYKEAIGYFSEAITAHRRIYGDRTMNDEQLSTWHQRLAHTHAQLGETREAVEAAAGAIVCWGASHERRTGAVESLRQVLDDAKDLDAYVKLRDEDYARTGQESPMVRKVIGEVYLARGEHARAIVQFEIARDLQPTDREVSQNLIVAYDALGRTADAVRQLLAQIDYDRHDLKLYEQLADRLKTNEAEAERAVTSIVEAAPEEAENHKALAELRQNQGRWGEAIERWRDVAELRRLEPTGLLGLAAAEVHERQWREARATLARLEKTEWPVRFQSELQKVPQLRQAIPKE